MKSFAVIVVSIAIILIIGFYIPGSKDTVIKVIDRSPPILSEISTDEGEFQISLADEGSGLGQVKVVASQGAVNKEIYSESFDSSVRNREISFPLDLQAQGFEEGDVTIDVSTSDRALLANSASRNKTLLLDFVRPRLEVLTLQHVAYEGGAELVIYRASDKGLNASGVSIGAEHFPGFPISFLTSQVEDPEIFASLFALPFEFDTPTTPIVLWAADNAGNRSEQSLHFRIGDFSQPSVQTKLSKSFLESKIPELHDKLRKVAPSIPKLNSSDEASLAVAFKQVNEDYREILDQELSSVLSAPITARKGQGEFIKPMGSATSSNLGEKRAYYFDGKEISRSIHNGLDLASVQNDEVAAAQDGAVVMAKDHGIYGNVVVIDHGMGVSSLYGHLSSIHVNRGDNVTKGQIIGRTGQTGLAGGDHLHFEIRVRNTPVTPIEWWDTKWIKDNIDGKIASITTAE